MVSMVLKRTKKEPVPAIAEGDGKLLVGDRYLYTDTGQVTNWNFAIWFFIEKGNEVPDEIAVRIDRGG